MKRLTGLIAALAAAVFVAGCGGGDADKTTPIAVIGPVTGQYASFGAQMKNGGEMAVEDINAAGGVLGKKLDLDIGDDACDPKQAVAVANQMTGNNVALVAGHYCSGSSIPASKVYAESNMVQISPASTNPAFTDDRAGPNIYRVCGRDDQQGGVAGKYLASHFADKNIAIIDDKTAYGKGLAEETRKAMNAAGKQEVLTESYTAGEKDYSALVSKLKQANVDVLYLGGYHTEAGLIVRQMRDPRQLADRLAPVGRIGASGLAHLADVQVALRIDGNAMWGDKADPAGRIVTPAQLYVAVQIQHRDARRSVLAPRRRHKRKQRRPFAKLGHVQVARVVNAHVVGPRQIAPFLHVPSVQVEDLNPVVLAIAHQ